MLSESFRFCRIAGRTVEKDSYVPPAKHLASPSLTGLRKCREKYGHIFDERVGKMTLSFWKAGASLKLSLSLGRAQSRSHACCWPSHYSVLLDLKFLTLTVLLKNSLRCSDYMPLSSQCIKLLCEDYTQLPLSTLHGSC